MTFEQINQSITSKQFSPVYLLQGPETYFIDHLTRRFAEEVLDEMEREFNQTVLYGQDVTMSQLIETLKRFPMMAEKQVVILKEAQKVKDWDGLEEYLKNPVPSTIFIVAHKYKSFDKRKSVYKAFNKHTVFDSEPIKEAQMGRWVHNYIVGKGYRIGEHASEVIASNLGTDLTKVVHAVQRISYNYPPETTVTDEIIEECVGIDREYNVFNLTDAILEKNFSRSLAIAQKLSMNKETQIYTVLPLIFSNFQKMMGLSFARFEKIQGGEVAKAYGIPSFLLSKYTKAVQLYGGKKIRENLQILMDYDLLIKGIGGSIKSEVEVYKEMIYKLMHETNHTV